MKIVTTNISGELRAMQPILGRGTDIQASHCFLFEADATNGVSITATNFIVGMKMKVFGQVMQPGKFVAPSEIAELLTNAEVATLEVNGSNSMKISVDDSFDGKLKGLPSEEYPSVPTMKRLEKGFELSVEAFEQLLGIAQFSAKSSSGKVTEGLVLSWREASAKKKEFKITAKAADGTIAAVTVVSGKGSSTGEVLIPSSSVSTLQKFASYVPDGEMIKVGLDKSALCVKTKDNQAWVTVMGGSYPDLSHMFKERPDMVGKLELGSLLAQIKITYALARSAETQRALLTFSPHDIKIAVVSEERGSGTAQVPCETNSQITIEKGFSVPLLLTALEYTKRIVGDCEIQLGNYKTTGKPLFIKTKTKQGPVTALVLPMVGGSKQETSKKT